MSDKLRLIVKDIDYSAVSAGVDAPVEVEYHTFDVDAPEAVAFLTLRLRNETASRMVIGAEVIKGAA